MLGDIGEDGRESSDAKRSAGREAPAHFRGPEVRALGERIAAEFGRWKRSHRCRTCRAGCSACGDRPGAVRGSRGCLSHLAAPQTALARARCPRSPVGPLTDLPSHLCCDDWSSSIVRGGHAALPIRRSGLVDTGRRSGHSFCLGLPANSHFEEAVAQSTSRTFRDSPSPDGAPPIWAAPGVPTCSWTSRPMGCSVLFGSARRVVDVMVRLRPSARLR